MKLKCHPKVQTRKVKTCSSALPVQRLTQFCGCSQRLKGLSHETGGHWGASESPQAGEQDTCRGRSLCSYISRSRQFTFSRKGFLFSTDWAGAPGTDRGSPAVRGTVPTVGLAPKGQGTPSCCSGNFLLKAQIKTPPSPLAHFPDCILCVLLYPDPLSVGTHHSQWLVHGTVLLCFQRGLD